MSETALYQNRPFWIGCADRDTGKIEEVHTYEEAERAGFHTCLYFSEQQETRSRQGDNIYFWIEEDGIIQFDANGLGPEKTEELICRIEDQLVFPKERQEVFEKGVTQQRKWLEETAKALCLDRQSLIFSEVHMTGSLGCERLFLPGYGREDVLKESPAYKRLAVDEPDGDIHVDVNTYVMGYGEPKEADWGQAELIGDNFADLIGQYQTILCSSDCYDICAEWDMEP